MIATASVVSPLLSASNLTKTYITGEAQVTALAGVSFSVEPGEFVALMGPSGCGKSTLLHMCGAMDRPSSGTLRLQDRDLAAMGDDELTRVMVGSDRPVKADEEIGVHLPRNRIHLFDENGERIGSNDVLEVTAAREPGR